MISVEDYRNSILFRHGSDMESSRYGASDGGSIVFIVETFSTVELQTGEIVRIAFVAGRSQNTTPKNSLGIHQMKTE